MANDLEEYQRQAGQLFQKRPSDRHGIRKHAQQSRMLEEQERGVTGGGKPGFGPSSSPLSSVGADLAAKRDYYFSKYKTPKDGKGRAIKQSKIDPRMAGGTGGPLADPAGLPDRGKKPVMRSAKGDQSGSPLTGQEQFAVRTMPGMEPLAPKGSRMGGGSPLGPIGRYGGIDVFRNTGGSGEPSFSGGPAPRRGQGIGITGDISKEAVNMMRTPEAIKAEGDLALLKKWLSFKPSERGRMPSSLSGAQTGLSGARSGGYDAWRDGMGSEWAAKNAARTARMERESDEDDRRRQMHNMLMRYPSGKQRRAAMGLLAGMDRNTTARRGQDIGLMRDQMGLVQDQREHQDLQDYRRQGLGLNAARLGFDQQKAAQDYALGLAGFQANARKGESAMQHDFNKETFKSQLQAMRDETGHGRDMSKQQQSRLNEEMDSMLDRFGKAFMAEGMGPSPRYGEALGLARNIMAKHPNMTPMNAYQIVMGALSGIEGEEPMTEEDAAMVNARLGQMLSGGSAEQ